MSTVSASGIFSGTSGSFRKSSDVFRYVGASLEIPGTSRIKFSRIESEKVGRYKLMFDMYTAALERDSESIF